MAAAVWVRVLVDVTEGRAWVQTEQAGYPDTIRVTHHVNDGQNSRTTLYDRAKAMVRRLHNQQVQP